MLTPRDLFTSDVHCSHPPTSDVIHVHCVRSAAGGIGAATASLVGFEPGTWRLGIGGVDRGGASCALGAQWWGVGGPAGSTTHLMTCGFTEPTHV